MEKLVGSLLGMCVLAFLVNTYTVSSLLPVEIETTVRAESKIITAAKKIEKTAPRSHSNRNVATRSYITPRESMAPQKTANLASIANSILPRRVDGVKAVAMNPAPIRLAPSPLPAPTLLAEARTPLAWPVDGKRITTDYAEWRWKRRHMGIDIAVPPGTEISPMAPGTVEKVAHKKGGWGKTVVVNYGLVKSLGIVKMRFSHCKKIIAKEGDIVSSSSVIAHSGNTGRSTGPHVDWRCYVDGVETNPRICARALAAKDQSTDE